MIFTHSGRLGDFFTMLPIVSWWHKKNPSEEIHIVLSNNIDYVISAIELCKYIPFINSVTTCGHVTEHSQMGGQPYIFDPNQYGSIVKGDYINIGFRSRPDKFVTQFFAEEHNLGFDENFTIDIPHNNDIDFSNKIVYSLGTPGRESNYKLTNNSDDYYELDPSVSIIKNLQICRSAKEVYTAPHGFSIALNLCSIKNTVFINHVPWVTRFFYFNGRGTSFNDADIEWNI